MIGRRTGFSIIGLNAVLRKFHQMSESFQAQSNMYREALRDVIVRIEGDAKGNLVEYTNPHVGGVDTGYLRSHIDKEIRGTGKAMEGIVGSKVKYAIFVEEDCRPHWVGMDKLELWAKRHGTSARVVQMAIARRGTYGKKYMEKAMEKNKEFVRKTFGIRIEKEVKR